MRTLILVVWLALPAMGAAYHYGPGQERLQADAADAAIAQGNAAAALAQGMDEAQARPHYAEAVAAYDEALRTLPGEEVAVARRIRLERAKAQMFISQLPAAHKELNGLVKELQDDPQADPELLNETRRAAAHSQYYMTWLMRLEGRQRADWEPEIEASRQNFRLLAEAQGETREKEDLEASIRLARADLGELMGLPLPSQ